MPQALKDVVTTAPKEPQRPGSVEEILVGSFRAIGRQFGPVVTVNLANRITAANEADEVDELSGFDHLIYKLRRLNSKYFVFDISKVTEVDEAALQHFLRAKSILEDDGGSIVLTGVPSSDDALLSDLLTRFLHFSNPEDAMRYLESDRHWHNYSEPESHSSAVRTYTDKGATSSAGFGSQRSGEPVGDRTNSREENGDEIFNFYSLAE